MENVTTTATEVIYPSLSERVQSTLIDTVFIVFLMFMASNLLDRYENVPDWVRMVLFFAIWGVYEPLSTSLGFTIGNYVKDIRVRKNGDHNRRINILQAYVRYVFKFALGWLSFLTIHGNKERRAIHDFAAGSVMVKKRDVV